MLIGQELPHIVQRLPRARRDVLRTFNATAQLCLTEHEDDIESLDLPCRIQLLARGCRLRCLGRGCRHRADGHERNSESSQSNVHGTISLKLKSGLISQMMRVPPGVANCTWRRSPGSTTTAGSLV